MAISADQELAGAAVGWRLRPVLPWTQRAALRGLILTSLGVALALLAALLFAAAPGWRVNTAEWAASAAPASLTAAKPVPAASRPGKQVDPRIVTLEMSDMPAGTQVLKAGVASFSSSGSASPPPSWDVLFQPDPSRPAGYDLAESLSVIYPSDPAAAAAIQSVASAERAARASNQAPTTTIGDRLTVWEEPVSGKPNGVVVRVTWQSMNVVGQVSVFGQAGPELVQRALRLAVMQQDRIGAPAPVKQRL
ncbi:MAG TPA: hypothetical protein VIK45_13380 [Candidatus Dormibacteraeota bacterium]